MSIFSKLFKKENTDNEIILALDIGTSYVKAVLFTQSVAGKGIVIKGYGNCKQNVNAMQGAMIINIENVTNACDVAIGAAIANAGEIEEQKNKNKSKKAFSKSSFIPRKVIIGIAGELVRGITIIADYKREDAKQKIDEKELQEVMEQIKAQAFSGAIMDISEEVGINPDNLVEINSKINSTYIDDVKVDDPIGFTGENISYRVYATFAPLIHVNSLKEIAKNLALEVIGIEVEPYAIARAIEGGRKENYSAVIIDVGGGTTDIAVVDKGSVAGTKMFALGGRTFTNRIAKDFNISFEDAEKKKLDYSLGKLDKLESNKVRSALNKDMPIYADGVELSLKEVEDDIDIFPSSFFICGGSSLLPEIKETLMQHAWLQVLELKKFPKIDFLTPDKLSDIVDETGLINDPSDIAPVSLARMYLEY